MINIAVIVAGIDEEYQNGVIEGIISCAREESVNISVFSAFGGVISNKGFDVGEYNIYSLINYSFFDGLILMTNTISDPAEKNRIIRNAIESGLPAAVLDCDDYPEFINISIDNITPMKEVIRHVVNEHSARLINYISGPLANPEAEDRYNAFLSVMDECGITPDARRIYFGEFRAVDGRKGVRAFLDSGMPKPDAVICANDAMALAAADELQRSGFSVPGDIIVTGFDNINNARHHSPALTTVSRPLNEAGYDACKAVLSRIRGSSEPVETVLSAAPVFTESCGCNSHSDEDARSFRKDMYNIINSCRDDISFLNHITTELAEAETAGEELEIIGRFVKELHCEMCCICLCSEWDSAYPGSWAGAQDDYQIYGYTRTMSAPLVWKNGEISEVAGFQSSDMYPVTLTTGGNVSYFLPLHFRERCLGYYIITNSDFPLKSMLCHTLMMNISNSIENIRKLVRLESANTDLERLYVTDQLCNIFNRNGFIRTADKMFKQCADRGEKILISFIDMDGLKLINDSYGHKEGDFALQRLAAVISDCCTDGRICARFGGDEFIIFGANASEDDIEPLERSFMNRINAINQIIHKPYEVAASIGTIVTEIDPDVKLFTLITRADEIMYEQKKKKRTSRYLRKA
ncbi:MAG: GGDEF domain-containing protein [Ruminococcus sp.]|nr:GGDEF domain-containing protein [Ruminococcus sp.]